MTKKTINLIKLDYLRITRIHYKKRASQDETIHAQIMSAWVTTHDSAGLVVEPSFIPTEFGTSFDVRFLVLGSLVPQSFLHKPITGKIGV